MAFQNESGSFSYVLDPKDENLFATVQAIPALAAQPFPIMPKVQTPNTQATCTPEEVSGTPAVDLPCAA
jgi:hypothetical protein